MRKARDCISFLAFFLCEFGDTNSINKGNRKDGDGFVCYTAKGFGK